MNQQGSNSRGKNVFILDSCVFTGLYNYSEFLGGSYTTQQVIKELKSLQAASMVEIALIKGNVREHDVSGVYVEKAREFAKKTGDLPFLSEADVSLIALALEIKERGGSPCVVTDDYRIQNLCYYLRIGFFSYKTRGIKSFYKWRKECPSCKALYSTTLKRCPVCSSILKTKLVEEERINNN